MNDSTPSRPTVLFCSAWPPAVGGAVSFALRVASDARIKQRFELVPQQILKRPSVFIPADRPLASTALGKGLRALSAAWSLAIFAVNLIRFRPAIIHMNYNARFEGALLTESCTYLRLARLMGARTSMRLGAPFHFFDQDPQSPLADELSHRFLARLDLLIVQSRAWQSRYEEWFRAKELATLCIWIPNTVEVGAESASIGPAPSARPVRIGIVAGPETEIKGAFVALEAFAQLRTMPESPAFEVQAIATGEEAVKCINHSTIAIYYAQLREGKRFWPWMSAHASHSNTGIAVGSRISRAPRTPQNGAR